MNSFLIQFKNDLIDDKFKFILLTALFTILSITAIITTFYMDTIMRLLGFEDFPVIVTPSARAAFLDFLGDQIFFGLLIMSLGSMGVLASEIESGTINFSLTRPISRRAYTSSRVLARSLALTVPFLLASIFGWIYLNIAFEELPLDVFLGTLFPILILYLYMGFLTGLLSSRLSIMNTGLFTIAILIIQFTLSVFEPLELLSPFSLANVWIDILAQSSLQITAEIFRKLFFLIAWMVIPLIATLYSMEKRDL
jgi:ABC-type transport system involved in multi-copper enzyme maturation permease subunit